MPLFEFRCPQCLYKKEYLRHRWNDYELRPVCPVCEAEMERMPSSASIQFKGEGWTKKGS